MSKPGGIVRIKNVSDFVEPSQVSCNFVMFWPEQFKKNPEISFEADY